MRQRHRRIAFSLLLLACPVLLSFAQSGLPKDGSSIFVSLRHSVVEIQRHTTAQANAGHSSYKEANDLSVMIDRSRERIEEVALSRPGTEIPENYLVSLKLNNQLLINISKAIQNKRAIDR